MDELLIVSREQILQRICSEYLEMPGLRLKHKQAQRLWGLDEGTCAQLLDFLVELRFLCRTPDGRYARLTEGAVPSFALRMAKAQLNSTAVVSRTPGKPFAA